MGNSFKDSKTKDLNAIVTLDEIQSLQIFRKLKIRTFGNIFNIKPKNLIAVYEMIYRIKVQCRF